MSSTLKGTVNQEAGSSLLALALFIFALGLGTVAIFKILDQWNLQRKIVETSEKKSVIRDTLDLFLQNNGRYPCPAQLNADLDTPEFGVEVAGCSDLAVVAGTGEEEGRGGRRVITGAIPVRSLNLPDEYIVDGFDTRFFYAVTSDYTIEPAPVDQDLGAITVRDSNGISATPTPGTIVLAVITNLDDTNGTYDLKGNLRRTCDTSVLSGENCDFETNNTAVFVNTTLTSTNEADYFVQDVSYNPPKSSASCIDGSSGGQPFNDVAFLLDTSGSMDEDLDAGATCPASLGSNCTRMDVSHWALRRVIPSQVQNKYDQSDPGDTALTGFVINNRPNSFNYDSEVPANLSTADITIDDPDITGGAPSDPSAFASDLEDQLAGYCPNGYTPLGSHMRGLADRLGSGTQAAPNKIIVISDGRHNRGNMDPFEAAAYIKATYDYLVVDIIDVIGDDNMSSIPESTGGLAGQPMEDGDITGTFFTVKDPQQLLDTLAIASGSCTSTPPTPVTDIKHCP